MTFNQNLNCTHNQRQIPPCKYCGRTNHLSPRCRYRKIYRPETELSTQPKEKGKSSNVTKTHLTPATFCSKFTKMNKNPDKITTKITKDGILTIDPTKEKKEYLKCETCIKWEMRLHEKMKLMDRIAEENIRLNKEVKLLKELYNVQGQKQGKKQL